MPAVTPYWDAIVSSLAWLEKRPEGTAPLVCAAENVIWRKVGRREPRKLVPGLASLTTALHPNAHIPGLDAIFPPGPRSTSSAARTSWLASLHLAVEPQ